MAFSANLGSCTLPDTGELCPLYSNTCPKGILSEPRMIIKGIDSAVTRLVEVNPGLLDKINPDTLTNEDRLLLRIKSSSPDIAGDLVDPRIDAIGESLIDEVVNNISRVMVENCLNEGAPFDEPYEVGDQYFTSVVSRLVN